ncbi:MAG: hypothetical protein AB7N91_08235 [Candidatus Tectimicrobiota bacterium]
MARTLPHHVTLHTVLTHALEQASGALHELIQPAVAFHIVELQSLTHPTCVTALSRIIDTQVTAVQLMWRGTTTGTCILAFPSRNVAQFVAACTGQAPLGLQLDAMHTAVFSEIGTLVLAHCVQSMRQCIDPALVCALPGMMHGSLAQMLAPQPDIDAASAVLIHLGCTIAQQYMTGYLILFCHSGLYEALATTTPTHCPEGGDALCLS